MYLEHILVSEMPHL